MERGAFAERIRLQLIARYHGATVEVDQARFALHVTGAGLDLMLPLAPLHHACQRQPDRIPALIGDYVTSVEHQLTPQPAAALSTSRLLWCVRNERFLASHGRVGDLLRAPIGADMTAFVAEELPGSIMRGVPREEWSLLGLSDEDVRREATINTAGRFEPLIGRIARTERIPADGWRVASDTLFQGSLLMAPRVLAALAERAGGDVLLGVPDRGAVLALPASLPSADRFQRRVLREWREAMNPCSRELLVTDGEGLRAVARRSRTSAPVVLPWLAE
ncbi:MAG TPA: hypothetical protein VND54_12905 [Candidatus Saccharimonadales bacterium]|nr:hypothetical protein [Candidatus Saccharimonadales bacterium]